MSWFDYIAYFFGGAFLANSIPHLVAGVSGRPFQTPFGRPPGVGLSSSTLNIAWGGFNLVVAYMLVMRFGAFDLRDLTHALALGLGFGLMAFFLARRFGRLHGGNNPLV